MGKGGVTSRLCSADAACSAARRLETSAKRWITHAVNTAASRSMAGLVKNF